MSLPLQLFLLKCRANSMRATYFSLETKIQFGSCSKLYFHFNNETYSTKESLVVTNPHGRSKSRVNLGPLELRSHVWTGMSAQLFASTCYCNDFTVQYATYTLYEHVTSDHLHLTPPCVSKVKGTCGTNGQRSFFYFNFKEIQDPQLHSCKPSLDRKKVN